MYSVSHAGIILDAFLPILPIIIIALLVKEFAPTIINNLRNNSKSNRRYGDYESKNGFMTRSERMFYYLLRVTFPEYQIFAQVRLADIVEVKKGVNNWQAAFNKIQSKSIDFILCDRDYQIICAIELDDPSHNITKRKQTDKVKDLALEDAGIMLHRIRNLRIRREELIRTIKGK
ncbi:MAG: DUF2726 domain-containing protein [Betaproteobacteria bacterium]|nr:DUF2726 domain-containing protein [Betaproteobacteria bacterium]